VFSTLVLMGMVTTMLTPWLLQKAFERNERLVAAGAAVSHDGIPVDHELVDDLEAHPEWVDAADGEVEVRQRWDYRRRVA
jgi:hypothetical protein